MRWSPRLPPGCQAPGFTTLELLLALAIWATVVAVAVPSSVQAIDEARTAAAARFIEARIMGARMDAVRRSSRVALRFDARGGAGGFAEYVDGNGNGVRTADIDAGVDPLRAPRQLLHTAFPHVSFRLAAGVPDVDGHPAGTEDDGVRIGTSRLLTLGPDGTATSGTLYIHGRRTQYAVRILGATGRTRVLRFDPGKGQWTSK